MSVRNKYLCQNGYECQQWVSVSVCHNGYEQQLHMDGQWCQIWIFVSEMDICIRNGYLCPWVGTSINLLSHWIDSAEVQTHNLLQGKPASERALLPNAHCVRFGLGVRS